MELKQASRATPSEARDAIYIDFEGFKDREPSLIGIRVEENFEQVLLDPALSDAARAKGLKVQALKEVVKDLVDQADLESRRIIAFTQSEINKIEQYTGQGESLLPHYRDAHKIAKRWYNRNHHGEGIAGWSLKDFMAFLGNPQPGGS